MSKDRRRDDEDDWRFDENPAGDALFDAGYESSGVGQWSTASSRKLNMNQENPTKMAKEKAERINIITPEFRASFPSVFQARKVNQNDPNEKAKFSVQMIFRVAETPESRERGEKVVDLSKPLVEGQLSMKQAVAALFLKNLGPDWANKIKERKGDGSPMYRNPFRDGNAADVKDKDGLGAGTIFVSASSLYKPGVIDGNKVEILNPTDFYGGCYARAQVNPYWYDVKGNKGVTFGLNNVQKMRDGEPFSGREKAEDVFDPIEQPAGVPAGAGVGASTNADPLA